MRYGFPVSNGLMHGLPVVLGVLIVVIYLRTAKRPKPYSLSEKWTDAPILWTAVDEAIPGGDTHGHGRHEANAGGGASGSW